MRCHECGARVRIEADGREVTEEDLLLRIAPTPKKITRWTSHKLTCPLMRSLA